MNYVIAFFLSAFTVGLKGFQHKNVIGNHYRLVWVTSVFMAFGDVLTIGLIVKTGWSLALPIGVGAALGMVISMWAHNRYIKPRREP
jgi:hypothetical protein